MPKKDKKADKKGQKETKDQLSAVDKTFFELTINDLNTKLSTLRKRNADLEEKNVELETQMVQLDEDRADIIAFLNRTVFTQTSEIKDLEEKLSELAKVRGEETEKFQNIIKDWESKFKAMHEQLSSEIKLLAGKLNYLEEFRLQHDDLMAKFDEQDRNLKEQEQRHKDTLYALEHKQIAEKVLLKNQLEGRLLELSNEFTKANHIRTAAHVHRLTRENITINKEIKQLLVTVEHVTDENEKVTRQNREQRRFSESILEENAHLVDAGDKYLKIITRLTNECEKLRAEMEKVDESRKLRKMAEVRETVSRKELNEAKSKLESIQTKLSAKSKDCEIHLGNDTKHKEEIVRLQGILGQLKKKVGTALRNDDMVPFEVQRTHLLEDLLQILTTVNEVDDVPSEDSVEIVDKMTPLLQTAYQKGKVGIAPRQSSKNVLKFANVSYKGRRQSILDAHRELFDASKKRVSLVGCAIIDVDETAARLQSCDSVQVEDEEKTTSSRKPSMIRMSHDVLSDDDESDK